MKNYYLSKKTSSQTNAINWFEIPTIDIGRARKFSKPY